MNTRYISVRVTASYTKYLHETISKLEYNVFSHPYAKVAKTLHVLRYRRVRQKARLLCASRAGRVNVAVTRAFLPRVFLRAVFAARRLAMRWMRDRH